mmetsp:Transcript_55340/g.86084  ORF Transcript_55340/g.86084 Transcript_55340/m.86084 type:complete len:174 (+) Transcript_55340:84-605(+)
MQDRSRSFSFLGIANNDLSSRKRWDSPGRGRRSPPRRGIVLEKRIFVASPENQGVSPSAHEAASREAIAMAKARNEAKPPMASIQDVTWYYLDKIGQEHGPVESSSMREWWLKGCFPVGADLLVRGPLWKWHLPLHAVYPNLASAFLEPPIWPEISAEPPRAKHVSQLGLQHV